MYKCNFFDQPMMTEWEKKAAADKTYANAVIFFNDMMASIKKYQENSGNSAKRNGFESANSALEIANQMKSIFKEHMGTSGEKTKAEHLLQMSTMQSAKDRQDRKIANMRKEISTLTRALTNLTHKMVEKSSKLEATKATEATNQRRVRRRTLVQGTQDETQSESRIN